MKRLYGLLTLFLLLLLVTACNTALPAQITAATSPPSPTPTPVMTSSTASPDVVAALEGTLERIYEEVNPSVVHIRVAPRVISGEVPPLGGPVPGTTGSGFVWDKEGHIVTNNHVVDGAGRITVTFADGTAVPAEVVGTDPDSDLAVLRVDVPSERLHPITVADSTRLKVGQLVVAIGNPFGLKGTMTVGVISALGRVLPTEQEVGARGRYVIPDVIQTDAAINPGNSGGVLVNTEGKLIGVTSAIISPVRASAGIGFAIPSVIVKKVVPKLIEQGYYEHPWIGISGITLSPDVAEAMNLDRDQRGVLVIEVIPESPADKAGLRGSDRVALIGGAEVPVGGDVIVAIDDQQVETFDDLVTYLARYTEVGQTVTLTVLRDGEEVQVELTLAARPSAKRREPQAQAEPRGHTRAWLGIRGVTLTSELAQAMGLPEDQTGVLVVVVVQGSPADKAGLRGGYKPFELDGRRIPIGGDVIIRFDGEEVTSMADLLSYLQERRPGDKVTLTVIRDGETQTLEVTLGERPQSQP